MKTTIFSRLLLFGMAVLLTFSLSCTKDEEKDDECKETEMDEENWNIKPRLMLSNSKLPLNEILKEADMITFNGTIQKYYCNGNWGELFTYDPYSFDPKGINEVSWEGGFYVGRAYGFNVDNGKDEVLIGFELIAYFPDGKAYSFSSIAKGMVGGYLCGGEPIYLDIDNYIYFIPCYCDSTDTWYPYP